MTDFNLTSAEVMFKSQLWHPLLIINIVLGCVAVSCSLIVIVSSRRTSLGDGATLIFVRCLCVTDILTGVCAVSKALVLMNIEVLAVDCFLPESLIITAITASVLFLLWLNVDCFLHLNKPSNMRLHIAKGNIISGMVVVWNVAFILGFLPQMGWNAMERVCLFLFYYDHFYLLMVVLLWLTIVLGCYWMQFLTSRLTAKIKSSRHFLTPNSKIYYKYGGLTGTVHVQLITMCACCLPCIGYVIYCFLRYGSPTNFLWVNGYLPYGLTIFTFRSVVCSFLNGYKTSQIRNLMRRVSRSVANSMFKHRFSNYRRRAVRGRKVSRTPNINLPECWTVQQQYNSGFDNQRCPMCARECRRSIGSSTNTSFSTECLHCHRTRCICDIFDTGDDYDRSLYNYDKYVTARRNKIPFSSNNSSLKNGSISEFSKGTKDTNIAHPPPISVHHPRLKRNTRSYSEDYARRHGEAFNPAFIMNSTLITAQSPINNNIDRSHIRRRSISPKSVITLSSSPLKTESPISNNVYGCHVRKRSISPKSVSQIQRKDSADKDAVLEDRNVTKATPPTPIRSSNIFKARSKVTRQAASCPTSIPSSPSGRPDGTVGQTDRSGTISYFKRWTLRQAVKIRHYSYDGSSDFRQRDGYFGSFDDSKLILDESGVTEQTSL